MPRVARNVLKDIFAAAIAATNGTSRTKEALSGFEPDGSCYLLAIGKAAPAMAAGALAVLEPKVCEALIVCPGLANQPPDLLPDDRSRVLHAGHPLPDERSLAAGAAVLEFVRKPKPPDSLLVLISGGASALVEILPDDVTLDDLEHLNRSLLASGWSIDEINMVRRSVSMIKGGRLAREVGTDTVLCLGLSDVPDDRFEDIGSGPLSPSPGNPTSIPRVPDRIAAMMGAAPPAPEPNDPCFERFEYRVIATLDDALDAAVAEAGCCGRVVQRATERLCGDAEEAGHRIGADLRNGAPGFYFWGGETTVRLPPGPGQGGRCQALSLAAAQEFHGCPDVVLLAAGTDGQDGPGKAAGAIVDGGTVVRGYRCGFGPREAQRQADTGTFLAAADDLFMTAPTGTNVNDIVVGLKTAPGGFVT